MEKVSTLSGSTQRFTAHTRDRLACWASLPAGETVDGQGGSGDGQLANFELMCKTGGGAWVTARHATPRQTLIAFEAPISGLPEAAAHAHKLCDAGVGSGCFPGLG